ncbi:MULTISPECIES: hypothetical protein [Pseudoalteromonas]|uniref:Uncharacterized protein n=1 Tax=Pseudoalteromonas amylolytica TaxID=1859457 RepID=A0A1S1MXU3_9GAMM|nr:MULTISPECIES: hypothetical protein [Pseudoalteromonas]OHU87561.1 hypothetical protein BFC16_08905 [Pseudoalteromonas sp. JW3]OHU91004.1 hypothetical protein BET10_09020 [Pseudoalteromonas amylolytica]
MSKEITIVYGVTSSAYKFIGSVFNTGNNLFVTTDGGEFFENERALSLKELADAKDLHIARIVICSEAVTAILSSLYEANLPVEKSFFYNHSINKLVPYNELKTPTINEHSVLYAVYDLSCNLPCFDITNFVILSEFERRQRGLEHICFVILPNQSCSESYMGVRQFHAVDDYQWRIDHIIKSMMRCIPSCISIVELPFREKLSTLIGTHTHVYPEEVVSGSAKQKSSTLLLKPLADAGHSLSFLQPPKNAVALVKNFLDQRVQGKKLITVTLREYQEQAVRNNDLNSWGQFLSELDTREYYPVIIRDSYYLTSAMPEQLKQYSTFTAASSDFLVRLALYQAAYINMGISTGPTYTISFLQGAKSLIFHPINEDNPASSSMTAERCGLTVGQDYFFNDNALQKTIWQRDTHENITSQFNQLVALIAQQDNARGNYGN